MKGASTTTIRLRPHWVDEGSLLDASLCAVPGIGLITERQLWADGISKLDVLHAAAKDVPALRHRSSEIRHWIEKSAAIPLRRSVEFLARLRKLGQAWRYFDAHRDDVVFIDVETTGLWPRYDEITLIGTLAEGEFRCFRTRTEMRRAARYLKQFRLAVTFNGDAFDLRFLDAAFGSDALPPLHWDVRWALGRLNIKGPLTEIEEYLGLGRSPPLAMISGFDAVSLWRKYERGRHKALEILVAKLRADTSSLPILAALVFNAHARQLPFGVAPALVPEFAPPSLTFSRADVLRVLPWKVSGLTDCWETAEGESGPVARIVERPSVTTDRDWLFENSPNLVVETAPHGKWLVFVPRDRVDRAWEIVVRAMESGELGRWSLQAKVSTARPNPHAHRLNEHVICVFTPRRESVVNRIRELLDALRLTRKTIRYKSEAATSRGEYYQPSGRK